MLTITIHDTNNERYTYTASANVLGRRYDNIAEYITVTKPESETGRDCIMIVTYGDTVVDHIPVGDTPIAITSNLSQYASVKIGFAFLGEDGYIKNSEVKQFYFLTAQKPDGFVPLPPEQKTTVDYLISHGFTGAKLENNILSFTNAAGGAVAEIKLSGFIQEQADWNETNAEAETYIKNKPTKLSQFTNDSGFVTGTEISGKADKSYVDAELAKKQPTGDYATAESLNAHTGNTNNPHGVTAAQVGAYVKPSTGIPETDLSEEVQAKLNSGGGGGAENLLKSDVTMTYAQGMSDGSFSSLGYALGIEIGKRYSIELTHNDEPLTVTGKVFDFQTVKMLAAEGSTDETTIPIKISDTDSLGFICQSGVNLSGEAADDTVFMLVLGTGDGGGTASISHTVVFKSITEVAEIIADKVKNKLKITVNGEEKTYDGSEAIAVDIDTSGDSGEENLLGGARTPEIEGSAGFYVGVLVIPTINLTNGRKYTLKYRYNGTVYSQTTYAWNYHGKIQWGTADTGAGGEFIIPIPGQTGTGIIMAKDKTRYDIASGESDDDSVTSFLVQTIGEDGMDFEFLEFTAENQICIFQGETVSSIIDKIAAVIVDKISNNSSVLATVVFNDLRIADQVMNGVASGRIFFELNGMSCTYRHTANRIFIVNYVHTYADVGTIENVTKSDFIGQIGFGKIDGQNGGQASIPSVKTINIINYVADEDVTIDLIFY